MTAEQRSEASRKAALARWRRDLDEINAELEQIPDCPRCGCPLTVDHPEHAVTVDTLIRSMPDGVE